MCNLSTWQQKVLKKQDHKQRWKKCKNDPIKHDRPAKEVYVFSGTYVVCEKVMFSVWFISPRGR